MWVNDDMPANFPFLFSHRCDVSDYLLCYFPCGHGHICSAGLMYVVESNFSLKPMTHARETCRSNLAHVKFLHKLVWNRAAFYSVQETCTRKQPEQESMSFVQADFNEFLTAVTPRSGNL